jgi:site-specific DNA-cytosine methylase
MLHSLPVQVLNKIDFEVVSGSEAKVHARKFMQNNAPCRHIFSSLTDQVNGSGVCDVHDGKVCESGVQPFLIDLLIAGPPCQPFSQFNGKRFANGRLCLLT